MCTAGSLHNVHVSLMELFTISALILYSTGCLWFYYAIGRFCNVKLFTGSTHDYVSIQCYVTIIAVMWWGIIVYLDFHFSFFLSFFGHSSTTYMYECLMMDQNMMDENKIVHVLINRQWWLQHKGEKEG